MLDAIGMISKAKRSQTTVSSMMRLKKIYCAAARFVALLGSCCHCVTEKIYYVDKVWENAEIYYVFDCYLIAKKMGIYVNSVQS
jgi:tartrate dehydratase beta subunit/fumarate hydratase class I family protein